MVMFHIRIVYGDAKNERVFYFVHKEHQTLSEDAQKKAFDAAVQELNHIYNDYGRFATTKGVLRLFEKFGFEQTMP